MKVEFKDVVSAFDGILKPMGFRKNGHLWVRRKGEILQCLGIERSNSSRRFSFRFGVYIEELDKDLYGATRFPFKNCSYCHLTGVSRLMAQGADGDMLGELAKFEEVDSRDLVARIEKYFNCMVAFGLFEDFDYVSTYDGIVSLLLSGRAGMSSFSPRNVLPGVISAFCAKRAQIAR